MEYILTNTGFLGIDSFSYQLCTEVCADTCWEAIVYISSLRDCLTEIEANLPTGFTPDGDGINDRLDPLREVTDIGCLQNPENASLTVINRWGEIIFEAKDYQPWDGRFGNGRLVPQGAYFYILTFEVGEEYVLREAVNVLRTE